MLPASPLDLTVLTKITQAVQELNSGVLYIVNLSCGPTVKLWIIHWSRAQGSFHWLQALSDQHLCSSLLAHHPFVRPLAHSGPDALVSLLLFKYAYIVSLGYLCSVHLSPALCSWTALILAQMPPESFLHPASPLLCLFSIVGRLAPSWVLHLL